jgi:hypothetical protein
MNLLLALASSDNEEEKVPVLPSPTTSLHTLIGKERTTWFSAYRIYKLKHPDSGNAGGSAGEAGRLSVRQLSIIELLELPSQIEELLP